MIVLELARTELPLMIRHNESIRVPGITGDRITGFSTLNGQYRLGTGVKPVPNEVAAAAAAGVFDRVAMASRRTSVIRRVSATGARVILRYRRRKARRRI